MRWTARTTYYVGFLAATLSLTLPLACRREPGNRNERQARPSTQSAVATTSKPNSSSAPTASAAPPQFVPPKWDNDTLVKRQIPATEPRLYAKTRHVWIYAEPDAKKQWIGFLWTGGSVKLRDPKPRYGIGCNVFYAIEPRGYVCADGGRVTLDPKDPVVIATYPYSPRLQTPFLHRYGESRGAPLYLALPTEQEQRYRERDLNAHLTRVTNAREGKARDALLDGVDLTPAPAYSLSFPKLSASVHEAHNALKARSTVAYSAEVRFAGRDFLLTSDYRFIPKDRVSVYENRYFSGVKLTGEVKLPLAWFRDPNRPKLQRNPEGHFTPTGQNFTYHGHVALTGKREKFEGVNYFETAEGTWVKEQDVSVPRLAEKTPWGSVVGTIDENPARPKGRATWIEVSISEGWLLAYEGTTPVFTTLISAGRGGAPLPGRDPLETGATPVGRFSITGKFVSSTMIAPNDYIHSEVPYAQNITGPYALHAAYWHDNWGHLMSGGCINLSPIDALYMFQWTEPPAPADWYGTRWLPHLEPATTLIIRR